MPPPKPPPKNRLNSSSGEISSSNIGPPAPAGRALNPEKGEAPAPDGPALGVNLLSGSPPNLSYLDFLSSSDKTWKALDTTVMRGAR
jgi:hypothetical protein